jgi:formylglycine-generating enzyme required for sulfatase activity/tetratricopeptide (TPR) repeat protein
MRLFISHSHADNEFGTRLAEDLRRALGDEESVWYDVSGGLHGGDAWWRKIVQEIAARPIFVVVLSPAAMESHWVNDEIDLAWNLKNTPEGKTIIPVLHRACAPRADLRTRHIISFLPPRPYKAALAETLAALGVRVSAAPAVPARASKEMPVGVASSPSAIARTPTGISEQMTPQIEAAYDRRDWTDVARKAEFLLHREPDRVAAATHRMLGVALLEEGSPQRAREAIDTALALDPLDVDTLRAAARVSVALGDAEAAHTLLDDALALASDGAQRLRLLADDAHALRLAGRSAEEVRRCEEALRLARDDLDWRARRLVALTLAGRSADVQAEMELLAREATTRPSADSAPHVRVEARSLQQELTREARAFGAANSMTERTAIAERFAALLTRNAAPSALGDDPLSLQRQAPPRLPERLAALRYVLRPFGAVEAILPPLCDEPAGRRLLSNGAGWEPQMIARDVPHHWVTLAAYQIARYPVTVAEYDCFVRATGREPPRWENAGQRLDWQTQLARPDHPVVCVTWLDALAYAAWLARLTEERWRLPTEAEWESAARWDAQTQQAFAYPWGADFDAANCNCATAIGQTTPVGSYPAGVSPSGALDMAGNVWEWTSNLADDGSAEGHPEADPTKIAMLRGGSWFSGPAEVSGFARSAPQPNGYNPAIGFRLACIPERS